MIKLQRALLLASLIQLVALVPSYADGEIPSELAGVCTYHPDPAWWALARAGMHGKVVCQLKINSRTGIVDEVQVTHKTRFPRLNAACVLAAFDWRFKPGTITHATVPFDLFLTGYFREIH